MVEFAKAIHGLNYIVQRNWENLPDDPGKDLDLFVSLEDLDALNSIIKRFGLSEFVDVRYPGDDYYPKHIEEILLKDTREFKGFKIPSKIAHFLSLYHHSVVHKPDNPYEQKLKDIFFDIERPKRAKDLGVGYYV